MNHFFVFIFCAVGAGAQAQTTSSPTGNRSDAYWNIPLTTEQKLQSVLSESQTVIFSQTTALNAIDVRQEGLANQATLQVIAGSQNRLEALQVSDGNNADAVLAGNNNTLIVTQTGGGNAINFTLSGNNNQYLLAQDGGDTATLQGLQKDDTRLELIQGSGSNSFTIDNSALFRDPFGSGVPGLRIEQSGGASITVQQGRVTGN